METDDFGLARSILGDHPDQFYSAVGRIVCVCAVLEQQLQALRHALARVEQGTFTHQPVAAQIKTAYALAQDLPADDGERVRDFLARARGALERRNAIVHSAFPAQPSGQLLGHSPVRDKTVTDGTAQWLETNLDDLREFIAELSQLVLRFNEVLARSQHSPATGI